MANIFMANRTFICTRPVANGVEIKCAKGEFRALPPESPRPDPSDRARLLHVLAISTPQTCALFSCWQAWMRRMVQRDIEWQYRLHLWLYSPRGVVADLTDGNATVSETNSFMDTVVAKWFYLNHFMSHAEENATVLYTDIDIVPLASIGRLVGALPPTRDVTWMYNFLAHLPANSGFFVFRNGPSVREYLRLMCDIFERTGRTYFVSEQTLANEVLRHMYPAAYGRQLNWGTFSLAQVGALSPKDPSVTARTVAIHAIGAKVTNLELKVRRLNEAVRMRRNVSLAHGRRYWQRECVWADAVDDCTSTSTATDVNR